MPTNLERIGTAMEAIKIGLSPYVAREMKHHFGNRTLAEARRSIGTDDLPNEEAIKNLDVSNLFKLMIETWQQVFKDTLGFDERSYVSLLLSARNKWAHQNPFSTDDTLRVLDYASLLLTSVSSNKANDR